MDSHLKSRRSLRAGSSFLNESSDAKRFRLILLLLSFLLATLACRPSARSSQSYDQIRELVAGKTATEVERLLGKPDLRETVLDDQRWVWWNYTFLDGDQYAPEIRGQVVHLEITFQKPPTPDADARVGGPLSVSYSKLSRSP
jgi:hypothetical protein